MTEKTRVKAYRLVPEHVWETIRAEYLEGATARVLSERHGPARNTIYGRAQRQGWTKIRQRDLASVPPENEPDLAPAPTTDLTPRQAAAAAAGRAAREMARGRRAAAADFARLAETLARVADRLELGGGQTDGPEMEPEADALSLLQARIDVLKRERMEANGEGDGSSQPAA